MCIGVVQDPRSYQEKLDAFEGAYRKKPAEHVTANKEDEGEMSCRIIEIGLGGLARHENLWPASLLASRLNQVLMTLGLLVREGGVPRPLALINLTVYRCGHLVIDATEDAEFVKGGGDGAHHASWRPTYKK